MHIDLMNGSAGTEGEWYVFAYLAFRKEQLHASAGTTMHDGVVFSFFIIA